MPKRSFLWLAPCPFLASAALAQGTVLTQNLLGPPLPGLNPEANGRFGRSLACLGDIDGDGSIELAVGEPGGRDPDRGTVWLLSVDATGAITDTRRIGLLGNGASGDQLGASLANLGDVDGNGVPDLAVGVPGFAPNPNSSVFVVLLASDRSTLAVLRHAAPAGSSGLFGGAVAGPGDIDGDGVPDLSIGDPRRPDGGQGRGALWNVLLNPDGTQKARVRVSDTSGGFEGFFERGVGFGYALAGLGDLDGDGRPELAVGAPFSDFLVLGAVWILSLNPDGTVHSHRKIASGVGGFPTLLLSDDLFGFSLARVGDLDGDGVPELAVGANGGDDGGTNTGVVYLLFLNPDRTVRTQRSFSATFGELHDPPQERGGFGNGLAGTGDWNGDGVPDLAVGAPRDDRYLTDGGRAWLLALDGLASVDFQTDGDLFTALVDGQALSSPEEFGAAFTLLGAGANLGAAVFDSTPGGPNDPSQDPDLLVGKGHVLILQSDQAAAQGQPDVFDRPNDDPDGGLVVFEFAQPVRLRSLDLIDIDAGSPRSTLVTLRDSAARERTYTVPPGWTGDRVTDGPPGWLRLDLTTLAPQPGRLAPALAGQSAGFDELQVVELRVDLGGSGALDLLVYDPRP